MDFAIELATAADSWKVAKRAEELGFHSAWFEDSQMVAADPFVAMAAAAMQTSRIRLGTGVCIPTNRIPPVTANMLATLNALAPGRIDWGVGTGFSARRAMGLGAISVETLGRHLRAVRGLLARETVNWDFGGGRQRAIKFLNPEVPLFNTTDAVACHVAAMGPKSRELTAELGCHWITLSSCRRRRQSAIWSRWKPPIAPPAVTRLPNANSPLPLAQYCAMATPTPRRACALKPGHWRRWCCTI